MPPVHRLLHRVLDTTQAPQADDGKAQGVLRDPARSRGRLTGKTVSIPLRGSIPCNPSVPARGRSRPHHGRNPLTGLNPLQPKEHAEAVVVGLPHVAIPLRGSIPCNGTPQRTPSWTAPPEGGFVRKMKLGICTRRITGVFEGLHR